MATLQNKEKRQSIRHELYRQLETEGMSLPETVKELRKILGMDQAAFAKMLGLSQATLRKIE